MRESAAILLNSHEPGQDPRPSKHWQEMMDSYAPSDQPQPPVSTINHHIVAIDCRYQYHVRPAGTRRAMTSFLFVLIRSHLHLADGMLMMMMMS